MGGTQVVPILTEGYVGSVTIAMDDDDDEEHDEESDAIVFPLLLFGRWGVFTVVDGTEDGFVFTLLFVEAVLLLPFKVVPDGEDTVPFVANETDWERGGCNSFGTNGELAVEIWSTPAHSND